MSFHAVIDVVARSPSHSACPSPRGVGAAAASAAISSPRAAMAHSPGRASSPLMMMGGGAPSPRCSSPVGGGGFAARARAVAAAASAAKSGSGVQVTPEQAAEARAESPQPHGARHKGEGLGAPGCEPAVALSGVRACQHLVVVQNWSRCASTKLLPARCAQWQCSSSSRHPAKHPTRLCQDAAHAV
jgi:hypothetical protein